jgi:copper chaperone CopZ
LCPSCEKKLETELTEVEGKIAESSNLKETDTACGNLLD